MDFVCKLYGNTYAVHVIVALVGDATLNLALPAPLVVCVCVGGSADVLMWFVMRSLGVGMGMGVLECGWVFVWDCGWVGGWVGE